jgi:hypothetical protein
MSCSFVSVAWVNVGERAFLLCVGGERAAFKDTQVHVSEDTFLSSVAVVATAPKKNR